MKRPATPPRFDLDNQEVVEAALARALDPEQLGGQSYLHWDELRYRTPPPGWSREDWWFAIKMRRAIERRSLPLTDRRGNPFGYCLPDIVLQSVARVEREASGAIQLPDQVTNPDLRDQYVVTSLIEEAIASSQLEGAITTREVAKEMLRSGREPRNKDERMIVNNFKAMEFIRSRLKEPLTRQFILDLHGTVTSGTLDNPEDEGRLRTSDDIVVVDATSGEVVHQPPEAATLEERVNVMCAFANQGDGGSFLPGVLRSILLHFWLAYDHPFVDGNGRTARTIFYWSMLRQGYWLCEYLAISRRIKQSPSRYYRSFQYTETDANDTTYFLIDQLRVLRQSIDSLKQFLRRKADEYLSVQALLDRSVSLNHRQIALLGHALRHAGTEYTIEGHKNSHRVAYATARADLLGLEERSLLRSGKVGRRLTFVALPDLAARIRNLPA